MLATETGKGDKGRIYRGTKERTPVYSNWKGRKVEIGYVETTRQNKTVTVTTYNLRGESRNGEQLEWLQRCFGVGI